MLSIGSVGYEPNVQARPGLSSGREDLGIVGARPETTGRTARAHGSRGTATAPAKQQVTWAQVNEKTKEKLRSYGVPIGGDNEKFVLDGVDLQDKDLSGLDLRGVIFDTCNLKDTNFANAILQDAVFQMMNDPILLEGTNFQGADLTRVTFGPAIYIQDVDFSKANLSHARFLNVGHLDRIDFAQANLLHADFSRVEISDVDFSKSLNIGHAKFEGAQVDSVEWPAKGFSPNEREKKGIIG